jgi:hypothetical protein
MRASRQSQTTIEVRPSTNKSRVETQITITLYAKRLPAAVRKLHLPTESISKPKFLAKDYVRTEDTLELHTAVVCASAMQNPRLLQKALARARGDPVVKKEKRRSSTGGTLDKEDADSSDEDKPLNGGEVQICANCVGREHKRAARKKQKKPEDEDKWFEMENERIIIFNEKEVQDWKVEEPAATSYPNHQDSEPLMAITVPMRIACYCRHQGEKQGFQYVCHALLRAIGLLTEHQGDFYPYRSRRRICRTNPYRPHPHY